MELVQLSLLFRHTILAIYMLQCMQLPLQRCWIVYSQLYRLKCIFLLLFIKPSKNREHRRFNFLSGRFTQPREKVPHLLIEGVLLEGWEEDWFCFALFGGFEGGFTWAKVITSFGGECSWIRGSFFRRRFPGFG